MLHLILNSSKKRLAVVGPVTRMKQEQVLAKFKCSIGIIYWLGSETWLVMMFPSTKSEAR